MKQKRLIDLELIEMVKTLPCIACRAVPCGDAHHVSTRGARGNDVANNLLPICRKHHTMIHAIGNKKMCEKYPSIRTWLELAGRDDIIRRMNR